MVKREEGAMEAFMLASTLVLTAVTMLLVAAIALTARHEQTRAAADFAALAALQSAEGCDAARSAASRNDARLDACVISDAEAWVTASVRTGLSGPLVRAGLPARFVVSAHAAR